VRATARGQAPYSFKKLIGTKNGQPASLGAAMTCRVEQVEKKVNHQPDERRVRFGPKAGKNLQN
jgi:hypothetical protein